MQYSYRNLLKDLEHLAEEQLDMGVTVFDGNEGEFHPSAPISFNFNDAGFTSDLDEDHPYLTINE